MTLFALHSAEDLLGLRFAYSPLWETQAAVQAFADERARSFHEPWRRFVSAGAERLDLRTLLAVLPRRGDVPDFLTPPPQTAAPRFRDQLAQIRATAPTQVRRELERCRESTDDGARRRLLESLAADPEGARKLLADCLRDAWVELVAPFWVRIRMLLDRDVEERSRMLARHGLGRVLDELHPKIRWTRRGFRLRMAAIVRSSSTSAVSS